MIWAVLAVVVSTPPVVSTVVAPQGVASTYDEAACAEAQAEGDVADNEVNCSEPPALPAVLDCNDARASLWLGEMIGSCEQTRPLPGTAMKAAGGGETRQCRDGRRCGVDSAPLRAAARFFDDSIPALPRAGNAFLSHDSTPLPVEAARRLARLDGKRLERPPRSL
jgi:hypothetical protein